MKVYLTIMNKAMLYVHEEDAEKVKQLEKEKCLPLATMARSILIQKLKDIASIPAGKQKMDAKDTPFTECHDG